MSVVKTILLSLLVFLPSSSFYIYDVIDKKIQTSQASETEIKFAALAKVDSALRHHVTVLEEGSPQWLVALKSLAAKHGNYMFQLALYYEKDDEKTYLYWLNRAVLNNHLEAAEKLVEHYYNKSQHQKVIAIINEIERLSDRLLTHQAKSLLAQGKVESLKRLFEQQSHNPSLSKLKQVFNQYRVFYSNGEEGISLLTLQPAMKTCEHSITLVGTSFENLQHLERLKVKLAAHRLGKYLCVDNIIYQPIDALTCRFSSAEPIMCDEKYWRDKTELAPSKYIAVMLPMGGANVHHGIMYFDRSDDFNVFTHELSHLLGFIDEYALPVTHVVCQPPLGMKGLNISLIKREYKKLAIDTYGSSSHRSLRADILNQVAWGNQIEETTPIMQDLGDKWLIGTPPNHVNIIGVYQAETCQYEGVMTVKPLFEASSLRHTDVEMPPLYLSLLALNKDKLARPHYFYNIALSLYRSSQQEEAKEWLIQAQKAVKQIR